MLFSSAFLIAWLWRERFWGAFLWGAVGAVLGQIHMSGFFSAFAIFLFTLGYERVNHESRASGAPRAHWQAWVLGSTLASLPLLPWGYYVWTHPVTDAVSRGWQEMVQLKFWVFWISDPWGLHLGNTLGVYLGPHQWDQLSQFFKEPRFFSQPTYLAAAAHLVLIGLLVATFGSMVRRVKMFPTTLTAVRDWLFPAAPLARATRALIFGFGIFLTLTGVWLRRYYLAVSFPLEFTALVALVVAAFGRNREQTSRSRQVLALIWLCQLVISASFVGYVIREGGSPAGDYGISYERVVTAEKIR